MVENLNIQKVLAPISLTSRKKNRQRSLEEELKEKKKQKERLSVDNKKQVKKTNINKEHVQSLKEKSQVK